MTDTQIAIAIVYFIPAFVAAIRGHMSQSAIAVLNIFTGWTIIGWVWALVWACTGNTKANRRPIEIPITGRVREVSQPVEQLRPPSLVGDPSMSGVLSLILAIFIGVVVGIAILANLH